MACIIYKKDIGVFEIVVDSELSVSDSKWCGSQIDGYFTFKSENGARLVPNVYYNQIQYIDETGGSSVSSFANPIAVHIKLKAVGFFDESVSSGGGGGADTFKQLLDTFSSFVGYDGYVPTIEGNFLVPRLFYNKQYFTQLDDVMSQPISADMAGNIPMVQMVDIGGTAYPKIVLVPFPTQENTPPDMFTQLGTITRTGNNVNVSTGYFWQIYGIPYANITAQDFTIENAATGNSRVDIIVAQQDNTFQLIQGLPSLGEGTAVEPQTPIGTLKLTSINIYQDNISEPVPTIDGTKYIEKATLGDYVVNTDANNIVLTNAGKSSFIVNATGNGIIRGLSKSSLGTSDEAGWLFVGTELKITDKSVLSQTLKNNYVDSNVYPFIFPNGQDLTMANGTIAVFRFTADNTFMFESYSGYNQLGQSEEYMQQPFFDFAFNTPSTAYPMATSAIGSGTLTLQSDSINPLSLRFERPREIVEAWTIRGNASAINGGYSVGVASQNPIYVGSTIFMIIQPTKIADTIGRFGLVNNNGISPLTSPSTGIYIEIDGASLTFKTTDTSLTNSSSVVTLTDNAWLFVMMEVESSGGIRCKVRKGSINGALILNFLSTSRLPIVNPGVNWPGLRISMNMLSRTAVADTVCQLGRVMTFGTKPNYLKSF